MFARRSLVAVLFAVGFIALPLSTAHSQYYYYPCDPFPLSWPFCIAGAAVGTAATVASIPFAASTYPYYYYRPYYYRPVYYHRIHHYKHHEHHND
jgi:hypothetical protein